MKHRAFVVASSTKWLYVGRVADDKLLVVNEVKKDVEHFCDIAVCYAGDRIFVGI